MEGDGPPLKKKSRFFAGGKTLFDNIQASMKNLNTSSSSGAPPALPTSNSNIPSAAHGTSFTSTTSSSTQEASFKDALDAFRKSNDNIRPSKVEAGINNGHDDGLPSSRNATISPTAAAFQELSINKNAKRRQGMSPEDFEELTRRNKDNLIGSSGMGTQPALISSANAASSSPPQDPATGTNTPSYQCQEQQEHLHSRAFPSRPAPAQGLQVPHEFPSFHTQSQSPVVPPREDPIKQVHNPASLIQSAVIRSSSQNLTRSDVTVIHQHRLTPNMTNLGTNKLPLHASSRSNGRHRANATHHVPDTLYTSPDRIPNALAASRKRKRTGIVLPPPAYIYTCTNSPDFNIFAAILLYPELCFHLSTHLPLSSLISLYAISRDFHTILDSRFTTVILSQSLAKAPESSRVFPFRCYAPLCRRDPASRIPHPDPVKAARGVSRAVPSFRWLKMILFREKVVHEIMAIMAEDGVPLPSRCSLALKRMWFIMDIPDNARRIGYIHSNVLVADLDLYFLMCFFVKLDMRFNDPCAQNVFHGPRKLILAQKSLSFLLRVLKKEEMRNQYEVMKTWIKTRYLPPVEEVGMDLFGVKGNEVGKGRFEYWGKYSSQELKREVQILLRPEQLVMREAVRRGIHFKKHFLRCLLYGYIRPDTLRDFAPRNYERRSEQLKDEYEIDDEIGGETVPREESARDPLLDLGEKKEVSVFCIKEPTSMDNEHAARRKADEEFVERCMKWSRNEVEWEGDVESMNPD